MQVWKRPGRRRVVDLAVLVALLALAGLAERWRTGGRVEPGGPAGGGGASLTGYARLIDGDSFTLAGDEVRLDGIDAPEGRQTCTREGKSWPCGEVARRELARLIGGRQIACGGVRRDQHGRVLARCRAGGIELNEAMVRSGYAVSFGPRYRRVEREARERRSGLWSGVFERPQDWRSRNGMGR